MNEPVLFIYKKEGGRQSEQSKKSEIRIHVAGRIEGKYGKEQTGTGSCDPQQKPSGAEKKLVERRERSHRLIVKGAEFEKAFPLSRDLEQEEFRR